MFDTTTEPGTAPQALAAAEAAFAELANLPLNELDDEHTLQTLEALARLHARADACQARALAHFAAQRPGPDGEFAPEEVALALNWTCATAITRMSDAMALVERLPATLAALAAGQIDMIRARAIADATVNLSAEHARQVEEQVLLRAKPAETPPRR
jgi:hypothetical protein